MVANEFRPGFRFSRMDAVVLILGAVGVAVASRYSVALAVLATTAVLHFFLFCNVFRVARMPELAWSALFVASAYAHVVLALPWLVAACAIAVGTVVIIGRQTRQPSYHGVLWQRINPDLQSWWLRQQQSDDD